MRAAIAVSLGFCLLFLPINASVNAARTAMSGDYVNDTISVAHSLKETIAIPKDDDGRETAEADAVFLITDYISRYRNRSQVNELNSYTTMQTALNAMAGHYKNSKRPLPDKLKDRLNQELSKAEKIVVEGN